EVFLGHSVTQSKNVSEATAQTIDKEFRKIIEAGYGSARQVLTEKLHLLHALAQGLLEHETLTGEEIGAILRGDPMPVSRKVEEPSGAAPSGGKRGSVPTTSRPPAEGPPGGIAPSPQPGA
ncbi:MAG TPA: cell division protein FtsH, partial [Geminicoccaceae bacterium]|nr:cell division protein FtsH [Geminicoccaceae bacterium]